MAKIGQSNRLRVVKAVEFGVYLDGQEHDEILMPKRYVPEDIMLGDYLEVFVYNDSEDRLVATTEVPYAEVGQFAYLKAKSAGNYGAFLDWGLMKDLLVPHREQKTRMVPDKYYLVYIYLDAKTDRVVATAKYEKFLDKTEPNFEINERVSLLICQITELGYKAIIDNSHTGMLYKNEVFQPLNIGQKLEGYIKNIREDFKIDLSLHQLGHEKISGIAEEILTKLKTNESYQKFNDKTDADVIYKVFGISKKNFKKALGELYKKRLISIEDEGIKINED